MGQQRACRRRGFCLRYEAGGRHALARRPSRWAGAWSWSRCGHSHGAPVRQTRGAAAVEAGQEHECDGLLRLRPSQCDRHPRRHSRRRSRATSVMSSVSSVHHRPRLRPHGRRAQDVQPSHGAIRLRSLGQRLRCAAEPRRCIAPRPWRQCSRRQCSRRQCSRCRSRFDPSRLIEPLRMTSPTTPQTCHG